MAPGAPFGIKKGPVLNTGPNRLVFCAVLLAVAEQLEQEHEHVDKVEIEVQGPHDRRLAQPFAVAMCGVCEVVILDLLCVVGCEACKDQNTDDRDCVQDRRRCQPDVDDRRNDKADHTHDKEATPAGDVLFRGVAPEGQTGKGDRGHKEDLNDREACVDHKDPA